MHLVIPQPTKISMYVDRQNDDQREEGEDEEEKDDVSFEGEIDD